MWFDKQKRIPNRNTPRNFENKFMYYITFYKYQFEHAFETVMREMSVIFSSGFVLNVAAMWVWEVWKKIVAKRNFVLEFWDSWKGSRYVNRSLKIIKNIRGILSLRIRNMHFFYEWILPNNTTPASLPVYSDRSVISRTSNFVITVPADGLTPNGAKQSAVAMLLMKSELISSKFL